MLSQQDERPLKPGATRRIFGTLPIPAPDATPRGPMKERRLFTRLGACAGGGVLARSNGRPMYESFFHLTRRPFAAAPLAEGYIPATALEQARTTLIGCVERAEGAA